MKGFFSNPNRSHEDLRSLALLVRFLLQLDAIFMPLLAAGNDLCISLVTPCLVFSNPNRSHEAHAGQLSCYFAAVILSPCGFYLGPFGTAINLQIWAYLC